MNVLMISFDPTMLLEGDGVPSDTRERHIKYAAALQQRYPGSRLTILVKVPPSMPAEMVQLSGALTVHPISCRRTMFALKAWQTARTILTRECYDLVTTQSPFDDGLVGVWLKCRFGVPLNVQMRSSFLDIEDWIRERPVVYRIFNALGKWVSAQADTVRVVSIGEKQRLEVRFPKLRGKIMALHPLVNVETFTQPLQAYEHEAVQRMLKEAGLDNRPFFLFVGRLAHQKNIPTLLRAFATVRRQNSDVALVIAGDGPLRSSLEDFAIQLQIHQNLLWLGNVTLQALRGWYASARACVWPSFYEGVAKVIIESYLFETPAIVTPFVCAPELFQNGETGFVTQTFTDPDEVADRMLQLLRSPELAETMGKKGKAFISNYLLSEEDYMQRLLETWFMTAERGRS